MGRYLNIAVSAFAFMFVATVFLILSGASLDTQLTFIVLTILSFFVATVIFIASVMEDIKVRKRRDD